MDEVAVIRRDTARHEHRAAARPPARPPHAAGAGQRPPTGSRAAARARRAPRRPSRLRDPSHPQPSTARAGAQVRPCDRPRAEQSRRGGAGRPGRAEVTLLCRGSGRALRPSVPRLEWRLGLGRRSGGFLAPRPREGVREAGSCRGFELGPDDGL